MTIPVYLDWGERHETARGVATIYVSGSADAPSYIGVIEWRDAPMGRQEVASFGPDLKAVRDEAWRRLTCAATELRGPGIAVNNRAGSVRRIVADRPPR